MNTCRVWLTITIIVLSSYAAQSGAEARRDAGGGAQTSKKAQYMIRQLHNEKQELQAQLAELQGKYDQLVKEHEKTRASLEKSSSNNEKLVSRVKGTAEKYKELVERYQEAVTILRKANMDNQYMVRAVQEREQWIAQCSSRNEELFDANSELLTKYGEAAGVNDISVIGLGTVVVENEMQDYRFKLEDLQVTKFKPVVDTESHIRKPGVNQVSEAETKAKVN
jgi:chromosome segregation ATPase